MADKSDCQHLDYGHTAPREYGMFCTRIPGSVQLIRSTDCPQCQHYKPKGAKFDQVSYSTISYPDSDLARN